MAQRAYDLKRAEAFYTDLLGIDPTGRFDPPGLLFYDLGPAGTDEWMAFIKDSEGNTLGLVSQLPPG